SYSLACSPPTSLYPHSLRDALPISINAPRLRLHLPDQCHRPGLRDTGYGPRREDRPKSLDRGATLGQFAGHMGNHVHHMGITLEDRKSTRLNSSHVKISYAVFSLKK